MRQMRLPRPIKRIAGELGASLRRAGGNASPNSLMKEFSDFSSTSSAEMPFAYFISAHKTPNSDLIFYLEPIQGEPMHFQ